MALVSRGYLAVAKQSSAFPEQSTRALSEMNHRAARALISRIPAGVRRTDGDDKGEEAERVFSVFSLCLARRLVTVLGQIQPVDIASV